MSAESSDRLMRLAQTMREDLDPRVRSLAMSVIRQFETDPDAGPGSWAKVMAQHRDERHPKFWEGFWAGMWAGRA